MTDRGAAPRLERIEPKGGSIIADRYQVDRLIARGGMAAVYLAHHVKLNRPVALKILNPPPDAEDPESFVDRFRLEAETLASLDHPNIVILHDFGETIDGRFFLAMEYVEGARLSDLLRDGPMQIDRALRIILQVCTALRYAHKRGVVHRDLKPSNLLVRKNEAGEEHLKVVDFGLVKLTEGDQSITRAGLILGSPHCMAPEQIKGLDVDHRADIYAMGILAFRTLTGQYPFHGANSAATMIAHLNQPTPTFFSVAPDLNVPAGLEEIVRKCLSKKADDRYPDMQSLIADLGTCLHIPSEQFKSVSQTHSSVQRESQPSRRWLYVAAGIAAATLAIVVAIGVGAIVWNRGASSAPVSPAAIVVPEPLGVTPEPPVVTPEPPAPEPLATTPKPPSTPELDSPVDASERTQMTAKKPADRAARPPGIAAPGAPAGKPTPAQPAPPGTQAPSGYMGLPPDLNQ